MNIVEALESGHSKVITLKIVEYIGDDKKRFKELMHVFLKGEYRLTQRAAWPMSFVIIEHPKLLEPYFDEFISKLDDSKQHPAISRNIYRVLQLINIPEKYEGVLIEKSFKIIMNQTQPAAVRAFAMTVASRISKKYPELKNELLIILNELKNLPQLPSMRSRIKMALKELQIV